MKKTQLYVVKSIVNTTWNNQNDIAKDDKKNISDMDYAKLLEEKFGVNESDLDKTIKHLKNDKEKLVEH